MLAAAQAVHGHAPPTPIVQPPLSVSNNLILDATGQPILLRGVGMPGLNLANPDDVARQTVAAMNAHTFTVLRERWNSNCIRLPVASRIWQRDGQAYLDQVAAIVKQANDAGLLVVLAEYEDAASGAADATGLPSLDVMAFWQAWAAFFKDTPMLIFDVFNEPLAANIPGHVDSKRQTSDWQFWLHGGTTSGGARVASMQDLVDAIRSTGAQQLIAVPALHDTLDFQGITPDLLIQDNGIIYEVHPFYDHALTDEQRDANFGKLAGAYPVYAGAWGMPFDSNQAACTAIPPNVLTAGSILFQTLSYFDFRHISWTAATFSPPELILDFTDYTPTKLDKLWTCGDVMSPQPGMGDTMLVWLTGDPFGFGTISPDLVTNAAGGPAEPVAPGEIVAIYRQQNVADTGFVGEIDDSGSLPNLLGDTQVLFDGRPAPVLLVTQFQINVQVPFEVAGQTNTTVQCIYKGVSSNKTVLSVVDTAPEIYRQDVTTNAAALNENGTPNTRENPADMGSVVTLFATGGGLTSPPSTTGKAAQDANAPVLPVHLLIAAKDAEVVSAGAAAGMVGVLKVNARLPQAFDVTSAVSPQALSMFLRVGEQWSRQNLVTLWVRTQK
jgi:uncharacterized protein (TIGR03437 family)